jgi:mercuric ion binding protein
MKFILFIKTLLISLALAGATPLLAASQTVRLSVPGMTCSACPITVKKALLQVKGVIKTEVKYKEKEAFVTFDTVKTSIEAITKATENAGYPSTVKK